MRELRNLVERAIVMSPDGVPRLPDVLATGRAVPDREPSCSDVGWASLAELMHRYKSQLIARRWSEGGNQRRATELLGIHRPSLTRMLRDLGARAGRPSRRRPAACRTAC